MEDNDANGLAKSIEAVMVPRLRSMAEEYDCIGDIRGRGAMIAIELIKPGTLDPDADLAAALNKHCHAHGVVTLTTGTYGNVFRFLPPLTMPMHLLEEALTVLEQGFEQLAR
jgi:4-aminobutyrate aminotransferase / (S)-3-amino-2-methylpropionate transaminase / 5-aminovalerate transaminase